MTEQAARLKGKIWHPTPWTRTMKLQAFILAFCTGVVLGVAARAWGVL